MLVTIFPAVAPAEASTSDTGRVTSNVADTSLVDEPRSDTPDSIDNSPTIDAAGPYEGLVDTAITLAATAVDEDDDDLGTAWTYTGPGECAFSDDESLTSTVTCDTEGRYTLTLTTDDGGGPVTDTATLTICRPRDGEDGNTPPVNDAHGPYSGVQGEPIALAGTASDRDEDELTHEWTYEGPGLCDLSDDESLTTTITCDEPGRYTLKLGTSDGGTTVVDEADLSVNCAEDDAAPTPEIPIPPPTPPADPPATLPVTGSGTGPLAASGLFLVLLGIGALVLGRRRALPPR